eukprot:scaffold554526_cov55-Attheya_sp.AAC.1
MSECTKLGDPLGVPLGEALYFLGLELGSTLVTSECTKLGDPLVVPVGESLSCTLGRSKGIVLGISLPFKLGLEELGSTLGTSECTKLSDPLGVPVDRLQARKIGRYCASARHFTSCQARARTRIHTWNS